MRKVEKAQATDRIIEWFLEYCRTADVDNIVSFCVWSISKLSEMMSLAQVLEWERKLKARKR